MTEKTRKAAKAVLAKIKSMSDEELEAILPPEPEKTFLGQALLDAAKDAIAFHKGKPREFWLHITNEWQRIHTEKPDFDGTIHVIEKTAYDDLKEDFEDCYIDFCDAVEAQDKLMTERDNYKWEYENVCKFANDYESQRDQFRADCEKLHAANAHLSMVDHRAIGDIMLENARLKSKVKTLEKDLFHAEEHVTDLLNEVDRLKEKK